MRKVFLRYFLVLYLVFGRVQKLIDKREIRKQKNTKSTIFRIIFPRLFCFLF